MISKRSELLEKLGKATDRATTLAIQRGFPIPLSKKSSLIGNLCVEKNKCGYYDVLAPDKTILYENLCGFDVAVIVAQRYVSGEIGVINQVLILDKKYSKHHTDMLNYLNCMKYAHKKKDSERIYILEDKFHLSLKNMQLH